MTKEERELSIEYLEGIKDNYIEGYGYERHPLPEYYAIENAIKALEQQTTSFEWCTDCKEYDQEKHCCHRWSKVIRNTVEEIKQEPCEDAISRQAVIDVIEREQFKGDAISEIEKLPPVQPKPKIGHWIRKEDELCWWYECDQCRERPLHNRINDKDMLSDWCPNCGAKMINVPDINDGKMSEIPTGSERG